LAQLTISQVYFAYDTPEDYEPLIEAAKKVFSVISANSHRICCYVLIGYKGDTFTKAETRLKRTLDLGFVPFAMLYRDDRYENNPEWISFQAHWANPVKIYGRKITDVNQLKLNFERA
jgi:RNA binding exosome subunit